MINPVALMERVPGAGSLDSTRTRGELQHRKEIEMKDYDEIRPPSDGGGSMNDSELNGYPKGALVIVTWALPNRYFSIGQIFTAGEVNHQCQRCQR